ncbi:MAG: LysM peptidoglycan-binding domain-containing protein [Candidatus Magnetomorum sp.]|nr:LysM peptidoglycan-binding domain-containing protein [Candidatus Magnetomorum sp.]
MNEYRLKQIIFFVLLSAGFLLTGGDTFASHYFPEPASLKDNIAFWKKIYTEVSLKEGLIHDRDYPLIVFKKVQVGKRNSRSLSRFIKKEKRHIEQILKHVRTGSPQKWSYEERRIADLYQQYAPKHALQRAHKRIRFQRGQRERFLKGLERSGRYIDEIRQILKEYQVPLELAYLPHVESSFNPKARSKAGAAGLWQFIRSTGRFYMNINSAVDDRRDPILSTIAAAKLLRHNYEKLNSWPLAITAYNHGLLGIQRAVNKTGYSDISMIIKHHKSRSFRFASKNFYSCFIAASDIDENYKKYFKDVRFEPAQRRKPAELSHYIRPSVLCDAMNISQKTFKALNPAIKSSVFKYNHAIPKGTTVFFPNRLSIVSIQRALAKIPNHLKSKKPMMLTYTVRRGDFLGKIAKKTGVSAKTIARANHMKLTTQIYPGQRLYIPSNYSKRSTRRSSSYSSKTYRVRKGDFLGKIAKKTGVSERAIAKSNGMSLRSKIFPGQILSIPEKRHHRKATSSNRTYRVKDGDFLGRISRKTGVSVNRIVQENNISKKSTLYPGQVLIIPDNG